MASLHTCTIHMAYICSWVLLFPPPCPSSPLHAHIILYTHMNPDSTAVSLSESMLLLVCDKIGCVTECPLLCRTLLWFCRLGEPKFHTSLNTNSSAHLETTVLFLGFSFIFETGLVGSQDGLIFLGTSCPPVSASHEARTIGMHDLSSFWVFRHCFRHFAWAESWWFILLWTGLFYDI